MFYLQCQLLKPQREMSVFFEGERYPTLSSVSRLITTLNATINSDLVLNPVLRHEKNTHEGSSSHSRTPANEKYSD